MRYPVTCGCIWAFTYPSSVATHSLEIRTSLCVTFTTCTSGARPGAAETAFWLHPALARTIVARAKIEIDLRYFFSIFVRLYGSKSLRQLFSQSLQPRNLGARYPFKTHLNSSIMEAFWSASLRPYNVKSARLTCCTTAAMRRAAGWPSLGLWAIKTAAIRWRITSRHFEVRVPGGTSSSASNAG